MDVMTYTDARANLRELMDVVVADKSPVVISRQKGEAVVMVSLADWNAIEETMHLLSTGTNAARLAKTLHQLDAGKGAAQQLIEL